MEIGPLENEPLYADTLDREFNYVTPAEVMKWAPIQPRPETWNFAPADQLVDFAVAHGMKVKGHNLVWNQDLPKWIESMTDPDELRAALIDHVRTEVGHFRGRVVAWDVVNEAVGLDGTGLIPSVFARELGPDFIPLAFQTAHEADPDALLYYNDYQDEGLYKRADGVYALVASLVAQGIPIAGVGLQGHVVIPKFPVPADVAANMRRLAALGLTVNFSELDVPITYLPGATESEKLASQLSFYHDLVATCVAEPACDAITFWGFTDKYTYENSISLLGPTSVPLLFDEQYRRKPTYYAVRDALLGR